MQTYAPPRSETLRPPIHDAQAAVAPAPGRTRRWLLPGLLVLLSATLFVHLGQSSLFIDEVYSWRASRGSLADLTDALRYSEVTPPLYYLILHAWMSVSGGDSETLLRLPSVLAGVGLVGAVTWLGGLVAGRGAALVAGALTAISPIVLLYSQQVRAYVWVMLAVTIAVAAVVQATRDRSWRWLLTGAVAAACAVLLHYTALLVLIPLAGWLWLQAELDVRWRLAFTAAIVAPLAAVAPLAWTQLQQGHHEASDTYASLTTINALRLAGTPFDGRASGGLILWREIAAVVVIDALALLAFADRLRVVRARWLMVMCGAVPLAAIGVASALGQPVALTRYTAVAAPFILVAVGVVAMNVHRALTAVLLCCAVGVSGAALYAAQQPAGQNPDTRAAMATIGADWRSGDVVAGLGLLGFDGSLSYYGEKLLPPGAGDVAAFPSLAAAVDSPRVFEAAVDEKRLWFLADPVMSVAHMRAVLARLEYRVASTKVFEGNAPVQLIRAERIPRG
jgi:mannosyltransferase